MQEVDVNQGPPPPPPSAIVFSGMSSLILSNHDLLLRIC